MAKIFHVKGDLLDNDKNCCDVIVQQLNCLCVRGHGLSATISNKYPYANVYKNRKAEGRKNLAILSDRPEPGTTVLSKPLLDNISNHHNFPIVAGIFGQYDFGKMNYKFYRPQYKVPETKQLREDWFRSGLGLLNNWIINNNHNHNNFKIGFPYKIGCGLAGGDWNNYLKMIDDFSKLIDCQVWIYYL